MSFSSNVLTAPSFFSERWSSLLVFSLRGALECCYAMLVKLGTNRIEVISSPRNDLRSVTVLIICRIRKLTAKCSALGVFYRFD